MIHLFSAVGLADDRIKITVHGTAPEFNEWAAQCEDNSDPKIPSQIRRAFTWLKSKSAPEIQGLLSMMSEAIEGSAVEPETWHEVIQATLHKINPYRIAINANRFYRVEGKNSSVGDLVPDILILGLATHAFETTFVIWATALAVHMEAGPGVIATVGTIGTLMAVPFSLVGLPILEPACAAGQFAYLFSARFRYATKIASWPIRHLAVPALGKLFHSLTVDEPRLTAIQRMINELSEPEFGMPIWSGSESIINIEFADPIYNRPSAALKLSFARSDEPNGIIAWHLTDMHIDRRQKADLSRLRKSKFLKALGPNLNLLINDILSLEQDGKLLLLSKAYYLVGLEIDADQVRLQFRKGAGNLAPRKIFRFFRSSSTQPAATSCIKAFNAEDSSH